MTSTQPSLSQRARTWFNRALFNTNNAGNYFEYLVEGIDPMASLLTCKAKVVGVTDETHDTRTWTLLPNHHWEGFQAGQHVHLTVEKQGIRHTRTFSLSSSPTQWQQDGTVTMTIKKVHDGRVTPWLYDHLSIGQVVSLTQASGDFVLPQRLEGPIAYIAGGSGITPIKAQLDALSARGMPVPVTLLYFVNSADDCIFDTELQQLASRHPNLKLHYIVRDGSKPFTASSGASIDDTGDKAAANVAANELPQGILNQTHVQHLLNQRPNDIFLCGPHPLRQLARTLLTNKGFNTAHIHEEAFGLPPAAPASADDVGSVDFISADRAELLHSQTESGASLLELAESQGLQPTAGCRMGICYTCKCKKKSGQVRDLITGEVSSPDEEDIRLCVSTPINHVEIEL